MPTVGGLLSGLLVYSLAPEAEGHGTDAVIAAYHRRQGQIRPRVPLVKIVASALTLGTGGSGGREGPIAQIGAGFGSLLANLLAPDSRRTAHADGGRHGGGHRRHLSAPLAGALFAAEVLYRSPEFEAEVIMPAAIACVVSYCTFGTCTPAGNPSLPCPTSRSAIPWELGPLLACWCCSWSCWPCCIRGRFTAAFTLFHRLPLPPHFRPAVGRLLDRVWSALALYYLVGRPTAGAGRALLRLQRHPGRQ